MPAPRVTLIPPPRRIQGLEGEFDVAGCSTIHIEPKAHDSTSQLARTLATRIGAYTGIAPEVTRTSRARSGDINLRLAPTRFHEGYRLLVQPDRVELTAGGDPGLFYAVQTLLQLIEQTEGKRIPTLRIDDHPDYPVRGYYLDISRGRVPTRASLFALVERLASLKINQLQIYIEHTFAFARHPDIWAGADPLTTDDIRALDEHASRHHVELVPSLSTFGHFYTGLTSPRKHHLNEFAIDASQLPFSWWDRMGHYTLDSRNPESLELVREMILELRPLFRSRLFNICCDETFDLGKGRNAARASGRSGAGRLYLDFLKKLMRIVREAGCTPMFWGDIVGHHPELVKEVPRRAIALDWDYSANLRDSKATLFRRAGIPYYICPGVCGWDRWIHDLDTATANIVAFSRRGRRNGAIGLLNTDWGDRGHINAPGNSAHGIALGAAAGWNANGTEQASFDAAFAQLHWNDPSGRTVALMREASRLALVSWRSFTLWLDSTPHRPASWWDERTGVPCELLAIDSTRAFAAARRLERVAAQFSKCTQRVAKERQLDREEWLLGCRGQALMNRLGAWIVCLARGRKAPRNTPDVLEVTNDIRVFEREYSALWHARSRPSEYWRIRRSLLEVARRTEIAALRGVWVKTDRSEPPPAAR